MVESPPASDAAPRLMVVMGVAGCGKSTVAQSLAWEIGGAYLDGDDYHPDSNVAKMSRGIALIDADRWPWLENFASAMSERDGYVVGACSALRAVYRERIRACAGEPVIFIFLDGSKELIGRRLSLRSDHFMPASLLDSQFEILEPPAADELAIRVDIADSRQQIVRRITNQLQSLEQGK